jgi:hypothetical protein
VYCSVVCLEWFGSVLCSVLSLELGGRTLMPGQSVAYPDAFLEADFLFIKKVLPTFRKNVNNYLELATGEIWARCQSRGSYVDDPTVLPGLIPVLLGCWIISAAFALLGIPAAMQNSSTSSQQLLP